MIGGLLATIEHWATGLGGLGLLIVAALDSSFLSFPQVGDVLIIYLSTKRPELMPYYASMTTLGSLIGCLALYAVARTGGGSFLRRRFKASHVDRAMRLYQRHGLLVVVVGALLPPPTPFKLLVLLAGAAEVATWRFGLAIVLGRGVRYFGQGLLAVLYGERALELVRRYGVQVGLGLAIAVVAAAVTVFLVRRGRESAAAR